jgi:hypothetical protein
MKSRRDENFCTTKFISLLSDVEDVYSNEKFTEVANSFYNTFLLYLEKWSNNVLPLDMLHWTLLKDSSYLGENPKQYKAYCRCLQEYNEDVLFDKFIHIANISKTRMDEWNTKSFTTFERWSEIFQLARCECISLKKHDSFFNSLLPFLLLVQL